MTNNIEYFKSQAKLLLKDWKQRKQEHFGYNVRELFRLYDIDPHEQPTLMKAQHLLALSLGRKNWSELINDSEENLEYSKNAFIEGIQEEKDLKMMWSEAFPTNTSNPDTFNEQECYHGMVECLHCGQRFPIDKPNHLPSCDGEDWDIIPVDNI